MSFWSPYPEIGKELALVEEYIEKQLPSRKKLLTDISLDLMHAGGKRLRPAFLILSAKFGRYNREKIIPLAAAIEILHAATLVHDDIIDDAALRRGKETVQAKWGQDMAVYTGDYLFTKAFMILSNKTSFQYLHWIARAVKSICEGEVDQYEIKYRKDITVLEYLKRIYRKTAVLFAMSTVIGAQESRCSKQIVKALGSFGSWYGMAFQIRDDILDYTSTERKEGKPIGNDIKQGIYTLPLLYALKDPVYGQKLHQLLDQKGHITEESIQEIIELVRKTDALVETKHLADTFIRKAYTMIERLPNTQYKMICQELMNILL